jgi:hypothetical protein
VSMPLTKPCTRRSWMPSTGGLNCPCVLLKESAGVADRLIWRAQTTVSGRPTRSSSAASRLDEARGGEPCRAPKPARPGGPARRRDGRVPCHRARCVSSAIVPWRRRTQPRCDLNSSGNLPGHPIPPPIGCQQLTNCGSIRLQPRAHQARAVGMARFVPHFAQRAGESPSL